MRRWLITQRQPAVSAGCNQRVSPSQQPAVDRRRCVTDGGTSRDSDTLRAAAAPAVFSVDNEANLTDLSDQLAALVGADNPVGSPLSSLLSVPNERLSEHLHTVARTLQERDTTTVRSADCQLRTVDGRRRVTVEFTRQEADDGWLVGVVRQQPVEQIDSTAESASRPDRFRQLFEQLQDPVVEVRFVDHTPIVTAINPAFEATFGYGVDELVGEPLNEYIVPTNADAGMAATADAETIDREAANGEWTTAEFIRKTADGPRLFLFRGIPFAHNGQQRGFGVYTDITDRETQQRYHEVLNRLLRHNLRNDLNVIIGLADQLTNSVETDDPPTVVSQQLKRRALELVETTRRARELQSVIDRSETETAPVELDELVADACKTIRQAQYPGQLIARIDSPAVGIGGDGLREAVVELAENAFEHTTSEPTVEIRVEPMVDREMIRITVADDGPGIPRDERAVIEGSQSISPLDHASGLGLWLAKWIVEAYGGELVFAGPDERLGGAAVELRVRQTSAQPPGVSTGGPTERET